MLINVVVAGHVRLFVLRFMLIQNIVLLIQKGLEFGSFGVKKTIYMFQYSLEDILMLNVMVE